MQNDFENLTGMLGKILELTENMGMLISENKTEDMAKLLEEKGILIKEAEILASKISLSDGQKAEIKQITDRANIIEARNIEALEGIKEEIKKSLLHLNIGTKALNAYKYSREAAPRLVDSKE